MHIDILVEDESGKILISTIIDKIIDASNNTYKIHSYKGIGKLPKKGEIRDFAKIQNRCLLANINRLLNGIGERNHKSNITGSVVTIFDNDKANCTEMKKDLVESAKMLSYSPNVAFCIAIEEIEAWLLGDFDAIKAAYPKAKDSLYQQYKQDSICDTWEHLGRIIDEKQMRQLGKSDHYWAGELKCTWCREIGAHMNIDRNRSPSFKYFVRKLREKAN